jgi:hypothetical protein
LLAAEGEMRDLIDFADGISQVFRQIRDGGAFAGRGLRIPQAAFTTDWSGVDSRWRRAPPANPPALVRTPTAISAIG